MNNISKKFIYLLIGQGFSRLGNNFFTLALLWYVLEETKSSTIVGLTAILLTIPNILSMFTGTIVDRINRWKLMMSVDLIQIVLAFSLAIIGWYFNMPILLLIITTILIQTVGAFFGPAENAVIPLLVEEKGLTQANSLNQLVTMITKIIGLASGGILLTIMGPFTLIFINGLTFVVSLLSIIAIRPWSSPKLNKKIMVDEEGEKKESLSTEWKEGVSTIFNNIALKKIIPIAILVNFALAPIMSLNPVWVKDVLGRSSTAYGFVEASLFIGVIAGAILVNFLHKQIPYKKLMPLALFIMASSVIILSLIPSIFVTITAMVFFGISAGIVNTGIFTIMQLTTPNDFLGRVSGILIGATNISLPIGMAIGSFLSANLPVSIIFFIGGLIALIGAIVGLKLPNVEGEGDSIVVTNEVEVN